MTTRPIIIDCDPGRDDAVALLLALSAPRELDVLGITTVAGNVPLALTQRNARLVCELAGRYDVPVFAGCPRPMVRRLITAEEVHGVSGVDGMDIHEPAVPLQPRHAVDFIVDTLLSAEDEGITLVPTGPLTNIAMAIVKAPAILPKIREIVLMGGAMREAGNTSASAEFNILVDPHAAQVVFECERPIVVMGLDVTHQVLSTPARVAAIRALGNTSADTAASMLDDLNRFDTAKYGSSGAPLHDPCTVAYLLEPALFAGKHCSVAVETGSELSMGHTVVDFWGVSDREPNAWWMYGVDADGFYELLTAHLARYGADG